jgi:hypothetical protein
MRRALLFAVPVLLLGLTGCGSDDPGQAEPIKPVSSPDDDRVKASEPKLELNPNYEPPAKK